MPMLPLQAVQDPAVQQNFDAIQRAWDTEPIYRGTGSPEGVVTGGPGASYVDTATGVQWIHLGAAGSTGWRATSVASTALRTVTGAFVGATGATQLAGTGDWSVVRNSAGNFTVTFSPVFPSANVVVTATIYQEARLVDVTAISASAFTVITFTVGIASSDPVGLLFHAIGPA